MAYYDTIRTPLAFSQAALSAEAKNFADLQQSEHWETGASRWGTHHLFACRVLCNEPGDVLPLLASRIQSRMEIGVHDCIDKLVQGPREAARLQQMSEPEIVRAYELESLGYVWAALAPLLRPEGVIRTLASERSKRGPHPVDHGPFVPSDGDRVASLLNRSDTPSSVPSTVGYTEKSSAPLLEDFTVRFVSCFIRCVLNYAQPLNKRSPFVQYRDERLRHAHVEQAPDTAAPDQKRFQAIDDGGIQLKLQRWRQVAILEAKRTFQEINDGSPTISDELLAQIVGEALGLSLSPANQSISEDHVVTIVAVKHYVKLFHLRITKAFTRQFRTLPQANATSNMANYIHVDSTGWFNLNELAGRKYFVRHLLALVAWADAVAIPSSGEVAGDEGDAMDMEE